MKNIICITSLFLFVHTLAYGVDVEFTIEGNISDPIIMNSNKTFSAEIILKSRSSTPHGQLEIFLRNPDGSAERVYYCGGSLCVRAENWRWADNLSSYVFLAENISFDVETSIHQQGYGQLFARFRTNSGTNHSSTSYETLKDTVKPLPVNNLRGDGITSNSFTLRWNTGTDNVGVEGYRIFQGSTKVGETASNFLALSDLTSCTSYTLSVESYDKVGNVSSRSTTTVQTTSGQPPTVTLNTDRTSDVTLNVEATTQVKLLDGFVFKATSSSHSFSARIVSDACQPGSSGRLAYFGDVAQEPIEDNQSTETITEPEVPRNTWDKPSFHIYPNPADRYLNIACSENRFFKVVMISPSGVIVNESDLFGRLLTIDVSTFNNGIYWVKVMKPGHADLGIYKLAIHH